MSGQRLLECSFLIPVTGDSSFSDSDLHSRMDVDWLLDELERTFGGATVAPGHYRGSYIDPDTLDRVSDESVKYVVAVAEESVDELRTLLEQCCIRFYQKYIYLSVAGSVEFIEHPHRDSDST